MNPHSNSAIAPVQFNFNSLAIRIITDETGEPCFLANDVCAVLGYKNPRMSIERHCRKGGVSKRDTPTESGIQEMTYINEGNLYRLIIKSRKPEAEPFESWVCDEVLPTIRKTGSYEQTQYGLKQLPEPPTVTKAQIGFLFNRVNTIAGPDNKMRAAIWSRFQKHFSVNSYKELPFDKYDEACDYLNAKADEYRNGAEMLYLSNFELAALIDERVKVLDSERLSPPSTSSIDTYQVKILTVFTKGDEPRQSIVPFDSCIVSGSDLMNVKTFLKEYVPVEFMPEILGAVSQQLINNARINGAQQ